MEYILRYVVYGFGSVIVVPSCGGLSTYDDDDARQHTTDNS